MTIKKRIQNIKEYFKEMQIVTIDGEQVIYVCVHFPQGWVIDENIEEKYDVSVEGGNLPNEYYFATDIDNGEDKIFDAIEYNIEKMKDAIERAQLLKDKITELRTIFQDDNNSLNKLRSLKFTWDEDILLEDAIKAEVIVPNDNLIISASNDQYTTNKEVERQYTTDIKNNKKSKK